MVYKCVYLYQYKTKGDTTPYTHFLMKHSTLTLGDTSVGNFAQFYVETLFCPNPFKSPNYFLALHVPLWNRHIDYGVFCTLWF